MKIKEGFVLREVAGNHVVIAVGKATQTFNGMIQLNQTGALLFSLLEKGCEQKDLVEAMIKEYEIDVQTAEQDVSEFVDSLKEANLLA